MSEVRDRRGRSVTDTLNQNEKQINKLQSIYLTMPRKRPSHIANLAGTTGQERQKFNNNENVI
ncbi:hypothetical protein BDR04DRAFT_1090703, partial [Suillus decipiens]